MIKINSAIKTIRWLILNFSLISSILILKYYFKKKLGLLDYKKTFIVKFKFNGKTVKMLLRENNDDFAIVREIFLWHAYKVPFKEVRTIIDGGSHIGASAVYFSLIYPDCKILCIEPSKDSKNILEKNLRFNRVNFKIINKALSNKAGKINFNYDYKNPAYSKITTNGRETIETTTLERILKNSKDFIDLLKLDIEGEGIKVVKELDPNRIKGGVLEMHWGKYPKNEDIEKIIKSKGFNILPPMKHWNEINKEILYPFIIFERK
jgi:FkbM family methyltransferase